MSPSLVRIFSCCLPMLMSLPPIAAAAESRPERAQPSDQVQEARISVNVLGAVEKPGAYSLARHSTLLDALGAAGGWKDVAIKKISLLSGPAGEKPVVTTYDVDAILRGTAPNPKIRDHETVFVPTRIF